MNLSKIKNYIVYILIIFLVIFVISLLIDLFNHDIFIFMVVFILIIFFVYQYIYKKEKFEKIAINDYAECPTRDVTKINKNDLLENYNQIPLNQQVKNITYDKIYQKILKNAQVCDKSIKDKQEIDEYNNQFFEFQNYIQMDSNGEDPVDRMNIATLENNEFRGQSIANVYDKMTKSY